MVYQSAGEGDMPLLFMDNGCKPQSLDSLSAEESSSNTSGLEREGEEQQTGPKGTKRREMNRDAARKSRKKQTERADELHQELQCLEQSNSALQKEIAALKKDQKFYETVLERHAPHCRLSSSPRPSSARRPASSSPPRASCSPSPSGAKTISSIIGPQTLTCTKESSLSPSASALTPPAASSAKLSSSFSSQTAPHSLFSQLPLTTTRSTNITPSCVNIISNPAPTAAAQLQPDEILQNKVPQLYSYHHPGNARPPCELSPSPLPDPAARTLSAPPRVCSEPPPLPFPSRPSYNQQVLTSSASILSLLTVPSPLPVAPATSSRTDDLLTQPSPPPTPQLDPFKDISLSEFLERNEWILSGISNDSSSTTQELFHL